jgi:hypothetical protein
MKILVKNSLNNYRHKISIKEKNLMEKLFSQIYINLKLKFILNFQEENQFIRRKDKWVL